jgi:flagellar basal body-associated protein FliL
MASPRSLPARSLASSERRHRRSSFNGAKQLSAAQAPSRRILVLLGLLVGALLVALAVIVATHLSTSSDAPATGAALSPATLPATH